MLFFELNNLWKEMDELIFAYFSVGCWYVNIVIFNFAFSLGICNY